MMNWSSQPFVRIFFPLTAGILLAYWIPSFRETDATLLIVTTGISGLGAYFLYRKNKSWRWRWLNGFLLMLAIMFIGVLLTREKLETEASFINNQNETYVAEVISEPVTTERSVKMILRLDKMMQNDTLHVSGVRVMSFFQRDSLSSKLSYGDVVVFKAKPVPPEGPKNPLEFDYASYLLRNDIHATVFIRQNDWSLLGSDESSLMAFASRVRKYMLKALQENGVAGDDYAVAAAVLLGYDQVMDPELEQNYVTAGAMHILCVSGLHVGVIYLVLNFLLGFLRKNKFQQSVKVMLLLLLIWFYALLTGLSPSVLRASVMISLFVLANLSARYKDVYNTLAASAVLLLLTNPLLIFHVGFQLSYMAVLGILIFYKPVYDLIFVKNKVLEKVWSVVAVSVAAQLGTFPLAAHYFHFFPPWFWLTNMVIFPLSFAIIGAGMAFMVFSWVPVVSGILGAVLSGFVFMLNYIIGLVKHLPFNGIHDLYFPWIKVALVYLMIFFLVEVLLHRNVKFILSAFAALFLLLLFNTVHKYRVLNQHMMLVYSIQDHGVYDFIEGNEHVLISDSVLLKNPDKLEFHLKNSRIAWGLKKNIRSVSAEVEKSSPHIWYDGRFGAFGLKRFMVWSGKKLYPLNRKVPLDFLIVTGKGKSDLKRLREAVTFNTLIIDSSVPYWRRKKLKQQAEELKISYFDVNENGAYLAEF